MTTPATCAIALLVLALTGGPARSEGFRIRDLRVIEADVAAAFGSEYEHWAIPGTLNLSCCENDQSISLDVDRHTDEIGQDSRTDQGYIAELERLCAGMRPACRIEKLDVGSALGRILSLCTPGVMKTASVFVVKDGDRLMIRSSATGAAVARRNAEKALEAARPLLPRDDRRPAVESRPGGSAPAPRCPDITAR